MKLVMSNYNKIISNMIDLTPIVKGRNDTLRLLTCDYARVTMCDERMRLDGLDTLLTRALSADTHRQAVCRSLHVEAGDWFAGP